MSAKISLLGLCLNFLIIIYWSGSNVPNTYERLFGRIKKNKIKSPEEIKNKFCYLQNDVVFNGLLTPQSMWKYKVFFVNLT